MSSNESESLDDESENDGSDSGSAGTYDFPFRFDFPVSPVDYSIGRVHGVGYGVFVPIGI